MLQDPDPADWLMWRRTLNHWGHSPWTRSMATTFPNWNWSGRGRCIQVSRKAPRWYTTVYFTFPIQRRRQAMDAVTGDLFWEYARALPTDIGQYFPATGTNRNWPFTAISSSIPARTTTYFALDMATGELVWEHQLMDYRKGALQTSGPIIADSKVISGRGCEPEGGRTHVSSWPTMLRAARNCGARAPLRRPASGRRYLGRHPVRFSLARRNVDGAQLRPGIAAVFVGTSVTSPAPKFMLAGNDEQYLYHNSTLALDAITGDIVWYYQHAVDHWDLDHPFERLLVDTEVAPHPEAVAWINPGIRHGETRKVVTAFRARPASFTHSIGKQANFSGRRPRSSNRSSSISMAQPARCRSLRTCSSRGPSRAASSARRPLVERTGRPAPTARKPTPCTCPCKTRA